MNRLFALIAIALLLAAPVQAQVITAQPNPAIGASGTVQCGNGAGQNLACSSVPFVYGALPATHPQWRLAKANQRAGLARTKIAFIGDSITRGEYAGTDGTGYTNYSLYAWSYRVAQDLNAIGITTKTDSVWGGSNNTVAHFTASDPRVVLGTPSDWSISVGSLGGAMFNESSSATSTFAFTPVGQWDTCKVYYASNPGLGTFTLNADGGATLATVNTNTTAAYLTQTVTTTLGTHTLNLQRSAGGAIFFDAIWCYDSTATNALDWFNMGSGGSTSASWLANGPWDPSTALAVIQPKVIAIALGANDMFTAVPYATFAANYQALITQYQALGADVILITPTPISTSLVSLAIQQQYEAGIISIGAANNLMVIDPLARMGTYAVANGLGEMFNTLHPNGLGQADMSDQIFQALSAN